MSFSDHWEAATLNHLFMNAALPQPTAIYVGLSSTTPNEDGTGVTEPATGAYARVLTSPGDWSAPSLVADDYSETTNVNSLDFPEATDDWLAGADITTLVYFDAPTGGNFLNQGAMLTARAVLSGDSAKVLPGQAKVRLR